MVSNHKSRAFYSFFQIFLITFVFPSSMTQSMASLAFFFRKILIFSIKIEFSPFILGSIAKKYYFCHIID